MVAKYLNINIFCGDLARRVAHGYILLEDSIVSTADGGVILAVYIWVFIID